MAISVGTRIGGYEVVAPLGAGGMGEVYRARDVKLNRDVALKILPQTFSDDPERQARFRREATLLASLNHPNIGHIYGFEDSAATHALVLELVDGPTLADRLTQGSLDVSEALSIARQIVDAMEAAHESGVIHRDLKPANIKVRPDGTVKVLDFGLAKALDQAQGSGLTAQGEVSNSPTMTSPAHTAMGIILGTAAYMSPEQARGRAVDKRADVWAFGCVLFEMLTGKATFAGDNVTDTLAAVVRGEPEWDALPLDTPTSVRRLLRRCLAKDRKDRLSDIGVARLEIHDAVKPPDPTESGASVRRNVRAPRRWLAVAFGAGVVVAAVAAGALWPTPPPAPLPMRLALTWPEAEHYFGNSGPGLAIAPDGRHVAYFASVGVAAQQLRLRRLTDDQTRIVPGSDSGYSPFFSPDSQQVAFVATGKLWRASVDGGDLFEIGPIDRADRGAVWSSDGFIYSAGPAGVSRIPASGGARESLTTVNQAAGEISHRFPAVVPGNRSLLFTIFKGSLDEARIAAVNLETKETHIVMDLPGHSPQVTSTGHLVYLRSGVLMGVRFDASRQQDVGTPQPLMNGVAFNTGGAGHFAISATGTMVFVPDRETVGRRSLSWADRTGKLVRADIPPDAYAQPTLSPDGSRVALLRYDARGNSAIVAWSFADKALTTVTREPAEYDSLVWAPDGRSIFFASRPQAGSHARMMRQTSDGSAAASPVLVTVPVQTAGDAAERPGSFHPDGRTLVYTEIATSSAGIWRVDIQSGKPERLLPDSALFGRVSPDGRWLTFATRSLLQPSQVMIVPYPDASRGRWPAGPPGGSLPRWSADGRELFFINGQGIFSVRITAAPTPIAGEPQLLVPSPVPFSWYDVAPGAQRFLVAQSDESDHAHTPQVIVNWFEELNAIR